MRIAFAFRYLDINDGKVARMLADDRVQYITQLGERAEKAAEANYIRTLHKCMKQLQPYKPRPIPVVRLEDGQLASSPAEGRLRWLRFFSEQQAGSIGTVWRKAVDHRAARADYVELLDLRLDASVVCDHGADARGSSQVQIMWIMRDLGPRAHARARAARANHPPIMFSDRSAGAAPHSGERRDAAGVVQG
ncbi:hypothetical protein N9L68_05270 [bacterium]|nr:hypothetical protein [bacterium]